MIMKLWLLLLILMGPISLLVLMINLLLILMVPISLLVQMIQMGVSLLGNGAAAAKHIPSQVLALSAVECTTVAIHLLIVFSPLMSW